jgi:hypothetical protein
MINTKVVNSISITVFGLQLDGFLTRTSSSEQDVSWWDGNSFLLRAEKLYKIKMRHPQHSLSTEKIREVINVGISPPLDLFLNTKYKL